MIDRYTEMKFSYAYNLAGYIREKVFKNLPEEYMSDLVEPSSHDKILKPDKETVLHDYIRWELENELEYLGRKADPDMIIEDWESLLSDYKIDFSRSEIDEDEDNYVDYLEIKLKENVVSKIADETFQLLFGDRMFCQKFNEIIAADIQGYLLSDYPDLLEKDGKPKRCAYFPEWVQRAVFLRDKGCCAVCLKDLTGLLKTDFHDAIDHIVPLNLGGINDITNFQLICRDCNLDKSGHTIRTSEFYPTYF